MNKAFKVTKATQQDLYGAFDIYDAEVSNGEYKADLWDIDEPNTLIVDGAEGAAMFLGCAHGELMLCNEVMNDYAGTLDYGRAYRAHARITKVMDQVLDFYKDEIVSNYYGYWEVKS